jgi:O-antigen/teichoic acid export membrane protein
VVLIVPKLIGVEEYGYWQLYLFYSSYVGFLHFGWSDGIYLRFGGQKYEELDKRVFFSQFYMLSMLQIIIGVTVFIAASNLLANADRLFILNMTAICMIIINMRQMLLLIMQGTNLIKQYARVTMFGRILYFVLILLLLVLGLRQYQLMIVADLIGKFGSLILAGYYCKGIVFNSIKSFHFDFIEMRENIRVGINLMVANIASTLIIGVVRFGIERNWDVETFGKVSLTLSISGLMMLFINAIGIVIFPILRRTSTEKLKDLYVIIRDFLMLIMLGGIILYFPLKEFLVFWLPKYSESLKYMALIFPMTLYEGKVVLLVNTYFKTLRKEKLMLKINLVSLALSSILTIVSALIFNSLNMAVLTIVIVIAFRCLLAELLLTKYLRIKVLKDILLELIMSLLFIFLGWFTNFWPGFIGYLVAYFVYLIIKKNDILTSIKAMKHLMKA